MNSVFAQLTSVSRHLETSEGCLDIDDVVTVDPNGSGADVVRDVKSFVDILGEDCSSETIHGVIGAIDDLFDGLELQDLHDGAEDFLFGDSHVVLDVREDGGLDEITFVTEAFSSGLQRGTLLLARLDERQDLVELGLIDLRTVVGGQVQWIGEQMFLGTFGAAADEFIIDRFLNERSRSGTAALSHVVEEGEVGLFDGVVQVSVSQNDVWALSSELEGDALEIGLGGNLLDELSDLRGPGKRDLIDVGVFGDGGACGGAIASDDVQDTSREASLFEQGGNIESGQGSLFGGLHDNNISGAQGWAKFPRLHQQRKVPWDDLANNSNGLMSSVSEERSVDGDGFALDLVGPTSKISIGSDGSRDIGRHAVLERLSVVKGLELCQVFEVSFHEIGDFVENATSCGGIHVSPRAPTSESCFGSLDSLVDISFVTFCNIDNFFTSCRIEGGESFPTDRVDPFVVDEELGEFNFDRHFFFS